MNLYVGVQTGNSPTPYSALNMVLQDIDMLGQLEFGTLKGTSCMAVHL